jgi:hypothetical protein
VPAGLYTVPVVVACAVLAWAGLEKIRNPASLTATVRALGAPARLAVTAAVVIPAAELVAVVSITAGVPSEIPAALVAALGTAFAVAGVLALRTRTAISCACFGASERSLGWAQVAALPLWLGAAWSVTQMPAYSPRARLESCLVTIASLAAIRAWTAIRLGAAARSDRRAMAGG